MDSAIALVGKARESHAQRMDTRERTVQAAVAVGFVAAAAAVALFLPTHRPSASALTVAALIGMYAIVSRVKFEIGSGWAVPEQLVFVPILFLAPLEWVPLLVALGFLLGEIPDVISGKRHQHRLMNALCDSWFTIGPVLVLGLFAANEPRLEDGAIYALAFVAQVVTGLSAILVSEHGGLGISIRNTLRSTAWSYRIDAILSPIGVMVAGAALKSPLALLSVGPLVWLLHTFSTERQHRYAASIELNRAYRGTVMLLSDVVEFEDGYTADHSRSVVELVIACADELRIPSKERQELEFAALLHDVGKIAIPKEILNKPAKLTDEEFELIKTHTLEGQAMLDRIGGLLGRVGRIVRSCHERWDGGGYPDRLVGKDIPLPARIVFCCDAYNAMTTDRPYRAALSMGEALAELVTNSGSQFDPQVVAALTRVVRRVEASSDEASMDALRAVFAGQSQQQPVVRAASV
jgi:HD-GYP domain-containing protein (c-di-GMP phosphodiesterase class II)